MKRTYLETMKEMKELSSRIGGLLLKRKAMLATAESCTGGNIAALITAIPGSSEYFKGSVVAYSNEVKMSMLNVDERTLAEYGAVSEQTVKEMVKGAIVSLNADYAVATSGIAGPGGGTKEKPVGTVWIAAGSKKRMITMKQETDNGRESNILYATRNALLLLEVLLSEE